MSKIVCPACGKEINSIAYLHSDFFDHCANHYKCDCGAEVIVESYPDGSSKIRLDSDFYECLSKESKQKLDELNEKIINLDFKGFSDSWKDIFGKDEEE